MTAERWLPIPGYEGHYEVSDMGRVRSLNPGKSGCIRTLHPNGEGYLRLVLWRDGRQEQTAAVHRLVMLAFVGPRPEGLETRHLDGDKANNTLANLAYGTRSENMYDRVRHGTDHNTKKTTCPAGHAYSPENTYTDRKGSRGCKTCRREHNRVWMRSYTPPLKLSDPDAFRVQINEQARRRRARKAMASC